MDQSRLVSLMEQCEADTARLLGRAASYRLAKWREYMTSLDDLVSYVARLLRGDHRTNGFELNIKGGMSLEKIVLDFCPELFDESDKREAAKTLGCEY